MTVKVRPEKIGNAEYYTIQQMAAITNRSDQALYALIKKGNAIRKMVHLKIAGRILIPVAELTEFPFTYSGPHRKDSVYHYDATGEVINA